MRSLSTYLTCSLIALGAAFAAGGCAEKDSGSQQPGSQGGSDSGLSPISPDLVYAKGWTSLEIDARGSNLGPGKQSVDSAGHYHTTSNQCGKPGSGVFDVKTWNTFAATVNRAFLTPELVPARCWDSPNGSKFYNKGIAEIIIPRDAEPGSATPPPPIRRRIYEYKAGQICTTLDDAELAESLMNQLETVLNLTDLADAASQCPGFRP